MLNGFGNNVNPYYHDEREINTHPKVGKVVWRQYDSRLHRYRDNLIDLSQTKQ
jgi:hypothetical protein